MLLEQRFRARQVVVAERHRQPLDRFRNAGIHRRGADEPVVGREERVVGAAADQIAAGIGARQPHRPGGRIRSVLAELDHLGAVDQVEELLGARHLHRRGTGEVAAPLEFPLRRLQDRRIGVPQADRPVAHAVFDVLLALGIPDPAAQAARNEPRRADRILIIALGIGVAAAWNQRVGALLEISRMPPLMLETVHVGAHVILPASLPQLGATRLKRRSKDLNLALGSTAKVWCGWGILRQLPLAGESGKQSALPSLSEHLLEPMEVVRKPAPPQGAGARTDRLPGPSHERKTPHPPQDQTWPLRVRSSD